jgi:hypothetical protein
MRVIFIIMNAEMDLDRLVGVIGGPRPVRARSTARRKMKVMTVRDGVKGPLRVAPGMEW